ncbi:hypothetical protein RB597_001869 [Gaeumannomyces tritici]
MAMNTCECSLTSRLLPGGDPKTAGFSSVDPSNDQLELSDYQPGQPGKDATKAVLSCKCGAGPGPADASIDLDERIELKDGKLFCVPAPNAGAGKRHQRRNAAPLHTRRSVTSQSVRTLTLTHDEEFFQQTTTAPATSTEPAGLMDLLNAGCKKILVKVNIPGKSILEAHCPIKTPHGSYPIYARYQLDLDKCIVNNGGVAEFRHRGMGGSSCTFTNTTNAVEWAYDCGGTPGTLKIAGRFTLDQRNNTLSCADDLWAKGQVPLDWACKDLRLSDDVPGALLASCPTDLSQTRFVNTTMDMNDCLGIDPSATGNSLNSAKFWPQELGDAFENCRLCSMWSTTILGSPMTELNCNCRHNATAAWPDWSTTADIGEHISFNPTTFYPTCAINPMRKGHRMTHSFSARGDILSWLHLPS